MGNDATNIKPCQLTTRVVLAISIFIHNLLQLQGSTSSHRCWLRQQIYCMNMKYLNLLAPHRNQFQTTGPCAIYKDRGDYCRQPRVEVEGGCTTPVLHAAWLTNKPIWITVVITMIMMMMTAKHAFYVADRRNRRWKRRGDSKQA